MRFIIVPPGLSDQLGLLLEAMPSTERLDIGSFTVLTSRSVPPGMAYVLDYAPRRKPKALPVSWWRKVFRWLFRWWDRMVEESRSPFEG